MPLSSWRRGGHPRHVSAPTITAHFPTRREVSKHFDAQNEALDSVNPKEAPRNCRATVKNRASPDQEQHLIAVPQGLVPVFQEALRMRLAHEVKIHIRTRARANANRRLDE